MEFNGSWFKISFDFMILYKFVDFNSCWFKVSVDFKNVSACELIFDGEVETGETAFCHL